MYLNTLDITMTKRPDTPHPTVLVSKGTVDILSLIFEFKVATTWQITRFLEQREVAKYVYRKLNRMWLAGFLESFKVYIGTRAGMPVYYVLSKQGLRTLEEERVYGRAELKTYPHVRTLLSLNLFKHEAQIVELASLEAKNKSDTFPIRFKGETNSLAREFLSNKNIEVLTPDYTVWYPGINTPECVYTEFERTPKSKEAGIRKLERYVQYLPHDQREHTTVRLIFQTSRMEELFWLNILTNEPVLAQKLRIRSTNLSLLTTHEQFLEPVYNSEKTIQFIKDGRLQVEAGERVKLFSFL